jgi:hypothetical protein
MSRPIDAPFVEPARNGLRSAASSAVGLSWIGARETMRMVGLFVLWLPAKLAPLIMLIGAVSEGFKAWQYWSHGQMRPAAMALLMIPVVLATSAAILRLQSWLRFVGREWV